MLAELRKHAQTGAALRRLALKKTAGMIGATVKQVGRGAKRVGTWSLANPGKAAVVGLGGAAALGAAGKTYHSFNPAVQRKQLGMDT